MKPETSFVAERMAARHCPQLLREGPAAKAPLEVAAGLGARVARALPARLAGLCGGERPIVRADGPREASPGEQVGALAVHCLFAAEPHRTPLVITIEGAAVFRLIDRAFGGAGRAPDPLPAAFPLSAELMTGRLESAIAAALSDASGGPVAPMCRADTLDGLAAFSTAGPLAVIDLAVIDGSEAPWRLTLTLPLAAAALGANVSGPVTADARQPATADPLSGPFGEVPLPLRAVLVDMALPFATLADLTPGRIIPVAVARSVPLETGGRIVARGAAGAMDDRVAIRISHHS